FPSQDESVAGRLIMGRSLSNVVAPSLARLTGQSLRIERELDASSRVAHATQGRDTLSIRGDEIDAVTPLVDIWGEDVAYLHLMMERPIQNMLGEARVYLLIATLI